MATNDHRTDMFEIYILSGKCGRAARRLYQQRFPDRLAPSHHKFSRLERNLRIYGSFKKPKCTERIRRDEDLELNILLNVEENPRTSTREIARNVNACNATVHSILRKNKLKPYVFRQVHTLEENDKERRIDYCNIFINNVGDNFNFLQRIIWSDECTFGNTDVFNRHNNVYWSRENPRNIVQCNPQRRFAVNVWCGIVGNNLIGPIFINGTLDQHKYNEILNNHLSEFLDNYPLDERYELYFQQDGAGPHNAHQIRNILNEKFPGKWMGTHGPIKWPARSPDLTPLDFFLWPYIKNKIYVTYPENVEVLKERIRDACREIPPNMLEMANNNVLQRCRLCVAHEGSHFEQFL